MRLFTLITLTAALAGAVSVSAQPYPSRPVRFIVPFPPGGATDIIAREIAQKLGEGFRQQVVVDNRGGGGQKIGTDLVAKSTPNGYTILLCSVSHAINPGLYPKLPYDSIHDFAPIALVASTSLALVVHPSLAANSVKELIALATVRPGKLNYGSSGNGTGGHLASELFKTMTGIGMTHIPYKGGGPAYVDLIAGQIDLMITSPAPMVPLVKAGKLRALATTGSRRSSSMPDVPTIAEAGVAGFEAISWYGILAPAGTSREIVARLQAEIAKALQLAEVRERFSGQGLEIIGGTPAEFSAYLKVELAKWSRVIKLANIHVD